MTQFYFYMPNTPPDPKTNRSPIWKALKAYDQFAYRMGDKILKAAKMKRTKAPKKKKEQLTFSLGKTLGKRIKEFFGKTTQSARSCWKNCRERLGKLNIIGQAAKYLLTALLILIVVAAVLPLLPVPVSYKPLVVMSGSMEPAIHVGALAIINPAAEYQTGDIITFAPPDDPRNSVTHRIHEIKKTEEGATVFVTKGDANDTPDSWEIAPDAVEGKVLFSIPLLGYLVNFSKTPRGFVFLIIIPAVLIILDELRIIRQELAKKPQNSSQPSSNSS